ncbi:hypothetical protein GCM10023152_35040 [Agromyces bauzanensis]|uniref:Uncharacterized protein n=1 Tax=Agromyces bauzanensis TaxID=1308924 RepID=A0A917UY67_9MICO|nr:hypothetical protein GCM10011372_36000 [Agromyces bauzanensis]
MLDLDEATWLHRIGWPGFVPFGFLRPVGAEWAEGGKRLDFLIDPSYDAAAVTSYGDELSVAPEDEPHAAPAMLNVRLVSSPPMSGVRAGSPTSPVETSGPALWRG